MGTLMDGIVSVTGNILVFCLVFGMSATVDTKCFRAQINNAKAIMTGIILQFLLMPFLGFLIVRLLALDYITGLMLLVVTCSPGGSYSNWWCSLFNADLALSVTMTAISTFLSIIMLPFNLYVYTRLAYHYDVVHNVEWAQLFTSIFIVIFAIAAGFCASYHYDDHDFNQNANRLGNFAGAALVVFSLIMANSNSEYQLWDRDWKFYFGVGAPCIMGLLIATGATTYLWLLAPERVTVSIECCYQNVGIAMSIAAAIFDGDELAQAIGVPVYYGFVEAVVVSLYCYWAWKNGWTKAPTDITLWKALTTSYEVVSLDEAQSSGSAIQLPPSKPGSTKTETGDWDYVEYGDAVKTDKPEQKANATEEPKKDGGWFSGFMS